MDKKNIPKSINAGAFDDLDFFLETADFQKAQHFQANVLQKSKIHFLFCLNEDAIFEFGPVYSRKLTAGKAFIIYNPAQDLPLKIKPGQTSRLVWLNLHLHILHELFAPGVHGAPVFNVENTTRKIYEEKEISPELIIILNQLFHQSVPPHVRQTYLNGKFLEILSLFFSAKAPDTENCPFLNDEVTIRKLKMAKEILLHNFKQPPTIPELAKQVELNELQLKVGFKEIYGNTPYQFLLDYKLSLAKNMLTNQKWQVNEVADKVGYANVSHFIEAFKRRFGVTPKKILKS